ncbi:hypothetical protein OAY00_03540 [Burkholderiales bacterium]|nr:hypothetical protein [Burkholderiales bacterium]
MALWIQKLIGYFCFVWNAEKRWLWPIEADVLIFDASGEELLRENLSGRSIETLPIRGESINIPVMLSSVFTGSRVSEAYFDAYIRRVKPKLIITFIDNTLAFYRLSLRHPKVKTMFIQNGLRAYHVDVFEQLDALEQTDNGLAVDYMMCFGNAIGQHYLQYLSGSVVVMGGLRNNRKERSALVLQDSIAYVSQWNPNGIEVAGNTYTSDEFFGNVDREIIGFLNEYSLKHNKRLYVIPRTRGDSHDRPGEAIYFSSLLGEPCSFLEYDVPDSSYKAIDAVDVLVGADSTLLYEAAARGKKTAFFSIRGTVMGIEGFDFGWPAKIPSDGPFWTNRISKSTYTDILDYLFTMDDEDGRRDREVLRDFMVFDHGNSILKRTLTEVLSK